MLLDTHNPYKPAVIDWPALKPAELKRLTSLPIWDIAVQTEGRASIRVATYAATVGNPLLRRALEMDGGEEARHKVVLSKLVEAYGIRLAPEPPYPAPKDPEWSWMVTGFSECIDSFFAFGLFRSAQRSGYFPPELVDTFEPVIQEEGRHILFFVNWYAWYWRSLTWWRRPWFFARVAAVWVHLIRERIGIARGIDADGVARDANFPATNTADIGEALKPRELIELCLAENDRRMAGYDKRLLRPLFVPRMARLALRFLKK
ncbi:putative aminomethyltransferase [Burkholderia cepacia]|nr:putative aminomethyltransferase [Burkholderia cepacia]